MSERGTGTGYAGSEGIQRYVAGRDALPVYRAARWENTLGPSEVDHSAYWAALTPLLREPWRCAVDPGYLGLQRTHAATPRGPYFEWRVWSDVFQPAGNRQVAGVFDE